jgi:large subunit ribosomal protein L4
MASASASVALPLTSSSSSFASSSTNVTNVSFSGLKMAPVKRASVVKRVQCKAPGGVVAMAVSLPVLTFEGEAAGEVELDLRTARPETAKSVVHRGVVCEMQNRRRGTASTLTRSEVRGGGRKPYKQKGTGRARQGSIRTPLRPGGGVVFGPKPKDWSIKINKKEKRLAISTALQSATVNTVVVEDFEEKLTAPKTKDFMAALKRWGVNQGENSLLFSMSPSENLILSSRNVNTFKLLTPRSLNLYDVLRADKLILTKSAVEYLEQQYGASVPFEITIGDGEGEEEEVEAASEEAVEPETTAPES